MTELGSYKTDAAGRQTGRRRTNKRTQIGGQFAPRLIEMLEAPPFRILSLSGHRVLDRIEVELAHHGGADNGRLPVTFQNFEDYGIDRHSIAPAIRECVALGFLEITVVGRSGNGEFRTPNQFRLTYRPVRNDGPTHEWRKIPTMEDAKLLAKQARGPAPVIGAAIPVRRVGVA